MVIQSNESLRQDSVGAQTVGFFASLLRGRDLSLPVMMRLEFESVEVGKTGRSPTNSTVLDCPECDPPVSRGGFFSLRPGGRHAGGMRLIVALDGDN